MGAGPRGGGAGVSYEISAPKRGLCGRGLCVYARTVNDSKLLFKTYQCDEKS